MKEAIRKLLGKREVDFKEDVPLSKQLYWEIRNLEERYLSLEEGGSREKLIALKFELGDNYEKLGDVGTMDLDEKRRFYEIALQYFAGAGQDARDSGKGRVAKKNYARASGVSLKLGNEEHFDYFSKQAQKLGKAAVKQGLDRRIRGVHLFVLFLASLFFANPRVSGAVTGVSFGAFSYLGIVFFVALLVLVNLKVYSKLGR
jgi:hypothetical protein